MAAGWVAASVAAAQLALSGLAAATGDPARATEAGEAFALAQSVPEPSPTWRAWPQPSVPWPWLAGLTAGQPPS